MVSIFPPNYGLTSILNISDTAVVDIIKNGSSKELETKVAKLYNKYLDSIGIDTHKMSFYKNLEARCKQIYNEDKKIVDFDIELSKSISFMEDYLEHPDTYFKDYVQEGRRLKKINKILYTNKKMSFITYTPFGTFKTREARSFQSSSNNLYFDIDIDLNKEEKKKLVEFFLSDPYVKAAWFSFSGKGFGFTVKSDWSTEREMKHSYYKLLEYFTQVLKSFGFSKRLFDTQVCSLNRMNVLSNGIICDKDSMIFKCEEYSDDLFYLLSEHYKKGSKLNIPTRFLDESDVKKIEPKNLVECTIDKNSEKDVINFLERITRNVSFEGSTDYNSAIKNYLSKVFRYDIPEENVTNFLFEKIPYTNRTERAFTSMWKCFSKYNSFQTSPLTIYRKQAS